MRIADRPPVGDPNWQGADRYQPGPYRLFNIGNGSPVRLLDFVEAIETALGKAGDPQPAAHAARRRARHLGRHRGAVRGDRL